jgi:hypothetical protein
MAPEQARDTRQATMASDVFSLGATVLFAATGHAPYQGETVMDVLVRLATEPPDLSGLHEDLAEIVRACLQRDPRQRPNPAAILADVGQETGSSSLPEPALALIAEYRRTPRAPAPGPGQDSTDPGSTGPRGPDRSGTPVSEEATFGSQPGGSDRPRLPRRGRRLLAAAAAAAGAAVIAGSVAAGYAVADSRRPPVPPPPPPGVVVPPSQLSAHHGGPQIAFYQPYGDSQTIFVLHGVGWMPGQPITVTLIGVRSSPEHPIVDAAGTFSYAINQNHEFFRGGLPARSYRVMVTEPDGAKAVSGFVVNHKPPPDTMSTTSPPGGSTKPGQ